jgi:hypothetical protein
VADGTPFDAIRLALAEVTAEAVPKADARLSAYAPAGDELLDLGSATRNGSAHASGKRTNACVKRARACLICGAMFEVNFRHGEAHRFCSAACRSRDRRAQAKRSAPVLGPVVE